MQLHTHSNCYLGKKKATATPAIATTAPMQSPASQHTADHDVSRKLSYKILQLI